MKAVGLYRYLPITDPEALIDLEIETPSPTRRDLRVKVETKVRAPKPKVEASPNSGLECSRRCRGCWRRMQAIVIQLAREVGHVKVIATASRPASEQWCRQLGADEVINHAEELGPQLKNIGAPQPDNNYSCNHPDQHYDTMAHAAEHGSRPD